MNYFKRMFSRTTDEISARYPDGALEWIEKSQPDIHRSIRQVNDKINAFWKTGDRNGFKKALAVYYKLHLEGFKRFLDAHDQDLSILDRKPGELTQADVDSFKALKVEVHVKSNAGDFTLVPEYTGREDRVEISAEDIAKLSLITSTFPGTKITHVGRRDEKDRFTFSHDEPASDIPKTPQKTFTRRQKPKKKQPSQKPTQPEKRQASLF